MAKTGVRTGDQAAPETSTAGRRGRGITRKRILDVALELFNEQGYDKTSLREIAERLGVTKAAIYYHFERKEDLLLELHLRLHALGRSLLERLDQLDERQTVAAWPGLIDELIDLVLANRDLFLFHQRNEHALRYIADDERHQAEQDDLEQRLRRLLANPALPLSDRVRMASSFGAVFIALIGTGVLFGEATIDEIAEHVRDAVRDLFRPNRSATRSRAKPIPSHPRAERRNKGSSRQ